MNILKRKLNITHDKEWISYITLLWFDIARWFMCQSQICPHNKKYKWAKLLGDMLEVKKHLSRRPGALNSSQQPLSLFMCLALPIAPIIESSQSPLTSSQGCCVPSIHQPRRHWADTVIYTPLLTPALRGRRWGWNKVRGARGYTTTTSLSSVPLLHEELSEGAWGGISD